MYCRGCLVGGKGRGGNGTRALWDRGDKGWEWG